METRKLEQVPPIRQIDNGNQKIPRPSIANRRKKNVSKRNRIIRAIGSRVKQLVPEGSQAVLFGSRARGDAREDSDWDVLVLLDKERIALSDYDEVTYPMRELGWDLGETINTVLYTKADWQNEKSSPFYENVTKEGIIL